MEREHLTHTDAYLVGKSLRMYADVRSMRPAGLWRDHLNAVMRDYWAAGTVHTFDAITGYNSVKSCGQAPLGWAEGTYDRVIQWFVWVGSRCDGRGYRFALLDVDRWLRNMRERGDFDLIADALIVAAFADAREGDEAQQMAEALEALREA